METYSGFYVAGQEIRQNDKNERNQSQLSRSANGVIANQPNALKVYSPLELFVNLGIQHPDLYNCLFYYILHEDQMWFNGFPKECPTNPGKAIFKHYDGSPLLYSPNARICSRCKEAYMVSEDRNFQSMTICRYHTGKRQSIDGVNSVKLYTCCGRTDTSNGCTIGKQHVNADRCFDNIPLFKTSGNQQNSNDFIIALDCEMCYTFQGLEVTRVSLVRPDDLVIYDTFVLTENEIVDYNTTYSGVAATDLEGVKTTLADVQTYLLNILSPSTILIGHGLENDLKALHIIHETVIDTSVVFAPDYGKQLKPSLRTLAFKYLRKIIQQKRSSYDNVKDARTCMELMLWKIGEDILNYQQQETFIIPVEPPTPYCMWQSAPLNMIPFANNWVPTPRCYSVALYNNGAKQGNASSAHGF